MSVVNERTWKRPFDKFTITFQFENVLGASETLSAVGAVTILDKNGLDVTSDILSSSAVGSDSTSADVTITGGDSTVSPYKITVRVATTASNQFENDAYLDVRDD